MKTLKERFNLLVGFICNEYEIDRNILLSRMHTRSFVEKRQVIMAILCEDRKKSTESFRMIGALFANERNKRGFDHATVMYACKTINNHLDYEPDFSEKYNYIKENYLFFDSVESKIFENTSEYDKKSIIHALLGC